MENHSKHMCLQSVDNSSDHWEMFTNIPLQNRRQSILSGMSQRISNDFHWQECAICSKTFSWHNKLLLSPVHQDWTGHSSVSLLITCDIALKLVYLTLVSYMYAIPFFLTLCPARCIELYIASSSNKHLYCFPGWLTLVINMSLVTRKPVFGMFDQIKLKLGCSASEAS